MTAEAFQKAADLNYFLSRYKALLETPDQFLEFYRVISQDKSEEAKNTIDGAKKLFQKFVQNKVSQIENEFSGL